MMQAATQARYELEIYRGTFKIPKSNLDEVLKIYNNGLVVEGACASGECLDDVCDYLSADFSIGVDLAGALLNDAVNSNGSDKKLYVQGDICKLPIRSDISGLYILNNVFDRVVNPMKAANEANRIVSNSNGVFVLSNCDPLQYGYQTDDCKEVLFVQEQNWLSLEDGLSIAGFSEVSRVKGIGADGWKLSTVAYGNENLPYLSLVGGRFEK